MRKSDTILIVSILAVALIGGGLLFLFSPTGKTVVIKQENNTVYTGKLSDDTTVPLSGNTAVIKDGAAYMESASCRNQICVHHKPIRKAGETVICLPNKVIIEIR